jgi:predicted nucleic acid-binding protein
MRLAAASVYEAHWTTKIQEEWTKNVLSNNVSITQTQLARTCRLMEDALPFALVTDYERHIPRLVLPDLDDRHVLATAIEAQADLIVTYNLVDFPNAMLDQHGLRAIHPDRFLTAIYEDTTVEFIGIVRNHRVSLRNPPKTPVEYLATLKTNQLHILASLLMQYLDSI